MVELSQRSKGQGHFRRCVQGKIGNLKQRENYSRPTCKYYPLPWGVGGGYKANTSSFKSKDHALYGCTCPYILYEEVPTSPLPNPLLSPPQAKVSLVFWFTDLFLSFRHTTVQTMMRKRLPRKPPIIIARIFINSVVLPETKRTVIQPVVFNANGFLVDIY